VEYWLTKKGKTLRKAMLPLMDGHTPIRKGIREEHLEMSLPSKRRTGQMFENPSFNLLKIREKPLLFLKKIPENLKSYGRPGVHDHSRLNFSSRSN